MVLSQISSVDPHVFQNSCGPDTLPFFTLVNAAATSLQTTDSTNSYVNGTAGIGEWSSSSAEISDIVLAQGPRS